MLDMNEWLDGAFLTRYRENIVVRMLSHDAAIVGGTVSVHVGHFDRLVDLLVTVTLARVEPE